MGKASRVRNAKLAVAEIKKEQQAALDKQNRRKKLNTIITAVTTAVVCVAFVVTLVVLNWVQGSGTLLRSKTAMTSDNLKISGTTFNYFFNYQYQNFVNENQNYLSYYGLDATASLRNQSYGTNQTWFDYMVTQTEKNVTEILYLAEKANADGISLTEKDKKDIDEFFVSLKDAAKEQDMEYRDYIHMAYGKGINEEDIRQGLELSFLATRYYTEKIDSLTYTDKEIDDYFDKNKNTFLYCDYKSYTFNPAATDKMTDKEKQAEYDKVQAYADRLAKATDSKSFDSILTDILKEQDKTEANIKSAVDSTVSEGNTYNSDSDVSKWAFGKDAKVNDTYIYKNSNARTVYLLTKAPYRDESETASVRHILISKDSYEKDADAKKKAQEVLDEYLKGEKTAEAFGKLAEKYTEDPGSKTTGGLYENFTEGTMVEEFNDWSFDNKRKEGDTEIVKTDYGYHIMYYVGKGEVNWKNQVKTAMKDEVYNKLYDELDKTYTVTLNKDILDSINEIRFYSTNTNTAS